MEFNQPTYKKHIKRLLLEKPDAILLTNKYKSAITLVDILEDELNDFRYDSTKDITFLSHIFALIGKLIDGDEILLKNLSDRFTYIHNYLKNLIKSRPKEMQEIETANYKLLQKIIDEMENTMLQIYLDNPVEYNYDKEAFIEYVIFTLKYENIVREAINKFPHIVNSIDSNNVSLIEKVLDSYLSSLDEYLSEENLGHIDDLIYYGKVLKKIVTSNKVKIDNYSIEKMIAKINEFYRSKHYTQNRHKEKLSFFINDCINILTNSCEPETIEYLNYKYEIHNRFKEAHNLEAKRIYIANKKILTPTTKRKIYTFDGEGAFELDDGLSITYEDGIYHLGVHIADPLSYIDFNSILMDEAKRRTTSIYIGDECIPQFPFILSSDTMSLNVGKQTYCMSYYFDIDALNGRLINFDIKNEICEIAGNYSYNQYDEFLNKGTDDLELFDTLMLLTSVSSILKKVYSENPLFSEIDVHNIQAESPKVIESAMIYTNYNVAKYFDERGLPFMYRCHSMSPKNMDLLNTLEENLMSKDKNMIKEINKFKELMQRAYYSSKNIGHFGLGIDYYSHITSPLRRLADIICGICIRKFYLNRSYTKEDIKTVTELIDEIAEQINQKRTSCVDYEIQYLKLTSNEN